MKTGEHLRRWQRCDVWGQVSKKVCSGEQVERPGGDTGGLACQGLGQGEGRASWAGAGGDLHGLKGHIHIPAVTFHLPQGPFAVNGAVTAQQEDVSAQRACFLLAHLGWNSGRMSGERSGKHSAKLPTTDSMSSVSTSWGEVFRHRYIFLSYWV